MSWCCRGKSESITISDTKNRLKNDDIDRMIKEAEEFATQDAELKKRIEKLDELSTFAWQLKSQVADSVGLGGKLSNYDKTILYKELMEVGIWLEEFGKSATMHDIEERIAKVQAVVIPITSALYRGPGFQENRLREDEPDQDTFRHTEL